MLYRHGDLIFKKLESVPADAKLVSKDKEFVLALGEVTGHKHVMTAPAVGDMQIYQDSQGRWVLDLKAPTTLTHEEHSALNFEAGIYVMENEREYDYFDKMSTKVLD